MRHNLILFDAAQDFGPKSQIWPKNARYFPRFTALPHKCITAKNGSNESVALALPGAVREHTPDTTLDPSMIDAERKRREMIPFTLHIQQTRTPMKGVTMSNLSPRPASVFARPPNEKLLQIVGTHQCLHGAGWPSAAVSGLYLSGAGVANASHGLPDPA